PWAEASLAYLPGDARPSVTARVGSELANDRLRGTLDYRIQSELSAGWTPAQYWRFGLVGSGALLEPWLGYEGEEASRTWIGSVEARLHRTIGRFVGIGGAVSSTWQRSGRVDLLSFHEMAVLLEVTATLPR
ncbi:MAG TPA: hypothetical protein VGD74_06700, partial [Vulgatibacter sp.]